MGLYYRPTARQHSIALPAIIVLTTQSESIPSRPGSYLTPKETKTSRPWMVCRYYHEDFFSPLENSPKHHRAMRTISRSFDAGGSVLFCTSTRNIGPKHIAITVDVIVITLYGMLKSGVGRAINRVPLYTVYAAPSSPSTAALHRIVG